MEVLEMTPWFGAHGCIAAQTRASIREGKWARQTSSVARGYVQGSVTILPASLAADFMRYCHRNPKAGPLLAVSEAGDPSLPSLGASIDIRTDVPRYRVWRHGMLIDEPTDVRRYWREDLVTFVTGSSHSFDQALADAGIHLRHVLEDRNLPMYKTSLDSEAAGPFRGPMVVSMRSLMPTQAIRAIQVSSRFPGAHGAPVHIGDPLLIGIHDLDQPDYGDAPILVPGEMPVFWSSSLTLQSAITYARPEICITHAPGAMLVTDLLSSDLATF